MISYSGTRGSSFMHQLVQRMEERLSEEDSSEPASLEECTSRSYSNRKQYVCGSLGFKPKWIHLKGDRYL